MHEQHFLELLHQEEGKLFYIAWGIMGQESDAWDVLQQTVEKAWCNRNKIKVVVPLSRLGFVASWSIKA